MTDTQHSESLEGGVPDSSSPAPGQRLLRAALSGGKFCELMSALHKFVETSDTGLAQFLCKYLTSSSLPTLPIVGSSVWPSVSPVNLLIGSGARPRSGRRAARWRRVRSEMYQVAWMFGVCTGLALGFDRLQYLCTVPWRERAPTPTQGQLAKHWLEEVRSFGRVQVSCTGGRATLADTIRNLAPLQSYTLGESFNPEACSSVVSPEGLPSVGEVKWLTASLLDIPDRGCVIKLNKRLSDDTLHKWTSLPYMRKHRDSDELPPAPCLLCTKREWLNVIRSLRNACLLVFLELSEILTDPSGNILRMGAFGLVKPSGFLRLILDRRPQNFFEINLPGLRLPAGVCFVKLRLSRMEILRLHLRDAS